MPLILYSYLLSEMVAPFLASLTILTAIMFLGRLLQIFDAVFTLGIGLVDFGRLSLYIIPKIMMFSLPLSAMFGVILCFSRLGSDNELLALRAGGISPHRLVPPVIIFSLVISLMAGYSSMNLMPQGLINLKRLMLKLAQDRVDRTIRPGSFSESLGGFVIYVDKIGNDGEWQSIYIFDNRKKENPVIVTAGSGRLSADYEKVELALHLDRGAITVGNQERMQHIDFERYSLSLPLPMSRGDATPSKHAERSQASLKEIINRDGLTSKNGIWAFIEYQQRWSLTVGCFILTMLGLPFAARSAPGRKQVAVPVGLALFLGYYILISYSETLAEQVKSNLILILWLPNIIYGGLALFNLSLMGRESSGRLEALLAWPGQQLKRLKSAD
ncbi:MAG: LptF/LptG family permease [Thermodesulfobacteriota bacterium]